MKDEIILKSDQITNEVMKVFYEFNPALSKEYLTSRGPIQPKLLCHSVTAALGSIVFKTPATLSPCPTTLATNSPSTYMDTPDVTHAVVTHLNQPCIDWNLLRDS